MTLGKGEDKSKRTESSKAGYLAKNVALMGASTFGSKILIILLVPLYTAVLSTEEFGSYDIISNTVGLLVPILTLNVADGVMRFALDANSDKGRLVRCGLALVVLGTLVACALLLLENMPWNALFDKYIVYIPVLFFATALYTLMTQFCRGCELIASVAVAGIVNTVVMLVGNIVFLLMFHWGLDGFFVANILAQLLPALGLVFRTKNLIFSKHLESAPDHELKTMMLYALPLMTTTLGWWFVSVSGRYIVTFFCGLAINGLFAVAYKIPGILNAFQTIFIQAWQISAVKEFRSEDDDGFFRKTYATSEALTLIGCSFLIVLSPFLSSLLLQNEFYEAWVYVPFLLVYASFNIESGIWGGIFAAKKDAFTMTLSTIMGAVTNVTLCLLAVPVLGAQGAALAAVASGFAIWAFRAKRIGRHIDTEFKIPRTICLYALLIAQAMAMISIQGVVVQYAVQLVFMVTILVVLRKELLSISQLIYYTIKGKVHALFSRVHIG